MKKQLKDISIKAGILGEFISALWRFKLWWGIPVILLIIILMVILLAAGHTGGAALIYPLF